MDKPTQSLWKASHFTGSCTSQVSELELCYFQCSMNARLAAMICRVEAGQNWLEMVTHQMNNMVRGIACNSAFAGIE